MCIFPALELRRGMRAVWWMRLNQNNSTRFITRFFALLWHNIVFHEYLWLERTVLQRVHTTRPAGVLWGPRKDNTHPHTVHTVKGRQLIYMIYVLHLRSRPPPPPSPSTYVTVNPITSHSPTSSSHTRFLSWSRHSQHSTKRDLFCTLHAHIGQRQSTHGFLCCCAGLCCWHENGGCIVNGSKSDN